MFPWRLKKFLSPSFFDTTSDEFNIQSAYIFDKTIVFSTKLKSGDVKAIILK